MSRHCAWRAWGTANVGGARAGAQRKWTVSLPMVDLWAGRDTVDLVALLVRDIREMRTAIERIMFPDEVCTRGCADPQEKAPTDEHVRLRARSAQAAEEIQHAFDVALLTPRDPALSDVELARLYEPQPLDVAAISASSSGLLDAEAAQEGRAPHRRHEDLPRMRHGKLRVCVSQRSSKQARLLSTLRR
jgi:hypothetical protein